MKSSNIEPELRSLLSKLTVEIEGDRKEIEFRGKRVEKNEALLRAVRGSLGMAQHQGNGARYGSRSAVLWTAIANLQQAQFTQDDVESELRRNDPKAEIDRARIRAALWAFANKTKRIRLIQKGTNLEPAVYGKVEGITRYPRRTQQDREQTLDNAAASELTASSFEAAVKAKSGRIQHLATRLKTDAETIKSLLEPASKVYTGSAGWLRVRE